MTPMAMCSCRVTGPSSFSRTRRKSSDMGMREASPRRGKISQHRANMASRVSTVRGMPRAVHSQKVVSCRSVAAIRPMTTMFGAPPSGVPAPPTAGATAESTVSERIMPLLGGSMQERPMVTAMETKRTARGMLGAMAESRPALMVNTRRKRVTLPLMKGRFRHQ